MTIKERREAVKAKHPKFIKYASYLLTGLLIFKVVSCTVSTDKPIKQEAWTKAQTACFNQVRQSTGASMFDVETPGNEDWGTDGYKVRVTVGNDKSDVKLTFICYAKADGRVVSIK